MNKAEIFRKFLSLASLSPVNHINITLFDNDNYQELRDGHKLIYPNLLFFIEDEETNTKTAPHQFLFTYENISDVFPDIIAKWYGFQKNLAPVINHLIASLKPKKVFTSLDFLIIVQALEGYHRRFIDKRKKSLKDRINELLDLFNEVQKINKVPIRVANVVESRHYYSHFYEKNQDVLDGNELFYLTKQLRNLLICCVLHLMGFEMELINRLLNDNSKT